MAFPVSLAGSVFQTYGGSRLRLSSPLSGASGGVWVYVGSQKELLWASIHTGGGDSRISGATASPGPARRCWFQWALQF